MKNKKLKELLKEYAITPEDTIINLQIAYEYFKLEQTASALTFFQRAAELSTDDNLAYECLIYIAKCLVKQGRRLYNAKNSILQAEALMPNRPEAFFEESLIEEQNSNWQEVYTSAIVAKNNWNNAQTYTSGEFYEKYQIDFQIALSLYNINRHEDSKAMFLSIKSDYIMNDYYADLVDINIKNLWPDEVKELHKTSDMDDTKIPVIGTSVVNGTKWLKRLIESVDYPVENFFIINNNGRGELDTDLEQIKNIKNEFIDNIFITNFPSNVGVPGAWNLIIKCYMNAPY
jgi:tetratricopeptide (TPR) repeat protein